MGLIATLHVRGRRRDLEREGGLLIIEPVEL